MSKFFHFAIAALLLLSTPVHAQPVFDDAGAAAIKKTIDDSLSSLSALRQSSGEGMKYGDITVTPKDGFYEMRIPDIRIQTVTGAIAEVGTIVSNVIPDANGDYKLTAALPQSMRIVEADGTSKIELKIGSQRFSGVWRPSLEQLIKGDLAYGDLQVNIAGEKPVTIRISAMESVVDMKENGDQTWSGPRTFVLRGITLDDGAEKKASLSIDSMSGNTHYDKINLAIAKKMKDQMRALLSKPEGDIAREDIEQALAAYKSEGGFLPDGMRMDFELKGLKVDVMPVAREAQDAATLKRKRLNLARFAVNSAATGLLSEKNGASTLGLSLEGLDVPDAPEELAGMIPSNASLDLRLKNLPMKDITSMVGSLFNKALDSSMALDNADTAAIAAAEEDMKSQIALAMLALPQQLSDAGTALDITNTFMQAADLTTTLDGKFTASPTSPLVAEGSMTLGFNGIDELIAKLRLLGETGNAKANAYAQGLILLQLSGQQQQAVNNKSLRTYKLELTPEGKALMNGADLSSFISGFTGKAQDPSPAPAPAPTPTP